MTEEERREEAAVKRIWVTGWEEEEEEEPGWLSPKEVGEARPLFRWDDIRREKVQRRKTESKGGRTVC